MVNFDSPYNNPLNDRIDHIVKHDRFPLAKTDWMFLIIIFLLIAGVAVFVADYLGEIPLGILVIVFAILLGFTIYRAYLSTLYFKKINTGFTQDQNEKLVAYCMAKLNFKLFTDKEHKNVFVCFVHDKAKMDRQEIYLVAKDKFILINSNKEKEGEPQPGSVDWLDRIGMTIYKTAFDFRRQFRNQ